MWHVGSSSVTEIEPRPPCIGSVESEPLGYRGSLHNISSEDSIFILLCDKQGLNLLQKLGTDSRAKVTWV